MRLNISEPILISMGPDSRKAGWGPYQFPEMKLLPDGRLLVLFNDRLDSEAVFGTERRKDAPDIGIMAAKESKLSSGG